jgi:hypothetical protein
MNAKIHYKQGEMWVEAKNAVEAIDEVQAIMQKSVVFFIDSVDAIKSDLENIGENIFNAEEKNPGLKNEMLEVLMKWG